MRCEGLISPSLGSGFKMKEASDFITATHTEYATGVCFIMRIAEGKAIFVDISIRLA
jgi:hypothetical protein